MSRPAKGTALVPIELFLCYRNRQLTGLLGRTTALIWAVSKGQTLVVEQLIAAGARLDVQDNEGYGRCADFIGRTLFNAATDFLAGSLRSSWPRQRARRLWSSSSSPPAPDSMSRPAKGTALVPIEFILCPRNRQLTGLLGRTTALIWAVSKGQTLVVEQLIAAGARLDVQNNEG
jgi:hypothetical protein